jgi:hypothetical protein
MSTHRIYESVACDEHSPQFSMANRYDEDRWRNRFQPNSDQCVDKPILLSEKDALLPRESIYPTPEEVVTYISPLAYLRSVLAIIRGALLRPSSTTFVDLSTGESVQC